MSAITTGVFPVHNNKFKIGTPKVTVSEMESFSVTIDGTVEEWTPLEEEGWMRRLVTAKSITISLSGKRDYGDAGNDYVAERAFKNGRDCDSEFEWEMPSGAKLSFDCVINVTEVGGGDSTAVGALTWDAMSSGKPTYTAPSAS